MHRLRQEAVFLALCLSMLCIQFDSFAIALSLEHMTQTFNISHQLSQWIISIYLFGVGLSMLPAGMASDMFGGKVMMLIGTFGFAASTALCVVADDAYLLMGLRFLQGMAAGILVPASLAYLSKNDANFAFKIAIAMGIGYVAMALGPIIGAYMVAHWGWQAIFGCCVPCMSLATLLTVITPETTASPNKRHLPEFTAICTLLGLLSLALPILISPVANGYIFIIYTIFGLLISKTKTCKRRLKRFVQRLASLSRDYYLMTLLGTISNIALLSLIFSFPLIYQNFYQRSLQQTGLIFVSIALCIMTGSFIAAKVTKLNLMPCLMGLFGLLTCSFTYLMLLSNHQIVHVTLTYHLIAWILGMTNTLTLIGSQASVEHPMAGLGTGLFKTIITAMGALGIAGCSHVMGQAKITSDSLVSWHAISLLFGLIPLLCTAIVPSNARLKLPHL